MSPPEVLLWVRLRPKVNEDFDFRRQVPLLGKYTADFYVSKNGRRIVFEVDGQIHVIHEKRDVRRDADFRTSGINVVRISAQSVFSNPDRVAEFIRMICMGDVDIKDIE